MHRIQVGAVQEDMRGKMRPGRDRLHAEGRDQGDPGRHDHPRDGVQDIRPEAHPVLRVREISERVQLP